VNPKYFVFGHERMHVHSRSNSNAANSSANGFCMVHRAVKVGGAEPPVTEGTSVNASSKVAIIMTRLQLPEERPRRRCRRRCSAPVT
jgi:hypothetical protein